MARRTKEAALATGNALLDAAGCFFLTHKIFRPKVRRNVFMHWLMALPAGFDLRQNGQCTVKIYFAGEEFCIMGND